MVATSQVVIAGATITDSPSSAGGSGEPSRVINRSSGSHPFDNKFIFNVSVTVGFYAPGEPGYLQVGLYAKIGGAWVEVGYQGYSASGTYNVGVSLGAVDFGAGTEFGMTVLTADPPSGSAALNSVKYTPGSVTTTSLTPAGATSIPYQVYIK
jgi:hypothetical protein